MSWKAEAGVLRSLEPAVARAASAEEAVAALAAALAVSIPIARVSLRILDPTLDELVMVGLWTLAPTTLRKGFRMPVRATALSEVRRYGRPVFSAESEERPTLVEQILRDEGIASWVVIPLFQFGEVVALLAFSSAVRGVFDPRDVRAWAEVGSRLQDRLLELCEGWHLLPASA